jgi:predicted dehydrogenase
MTRRLRVGFVGLGRVFDLNVRGYLDHPEAEISALCDADPDILARRAAEHPKAHATRDFEDLLRLDLDLIEILTPHPLHEAMTMASLAAGSHVSVQKPTAMTLPECDRMIEAAAASGRRLKVFESFVFYPPLVRARELVLEGAIGRPLHFRMKVVMPTARRRGMCRMRRVAGATHLPLRAVAARWCSTTATT